jgi:hypothetical protein
MSCSNTVLAVLELCCLCGNATMIHGLSYIYNCDDISSCLTLLVFADVAHCVATTFLYNAQVVLQLIAELTQSQQVQ